MKTTNKNTGRRNASSRSSSSQMYNRTSNLLKNNNQGPVKKTENSNIAGSSLRKEEPKTLNREIKIENKEEISIEKTNDILNQINQYLEEEKKKLN